MDDFEYIIDTGFKSGDTIIHSGWPDAVLRKVLNLHKVQIWHTSRLFDRPNNLGRWFIDDPTHMNFKANEVIANFLFDNICDELQKEKTNNTKTIKFETELQKDDYLEQNPEFKKYLDMLKNTREKNPIKGKTGSIVVNCNPFTLGHRYLIEESSKKVEHLYVFVVEEDKSVYPFKDRIELVKAGTKDLKNVTVLPSGKWIISLLTFPEYFSKDAKQKDTIDPSVDISHFGKYVAPALGINVRFVGEEPFDLVTRQYNDAMRNQLPKYGVEFIEIPRKQVQGEVISASVVRRLVNDKNFEKLKSFVPETTYNYLINQNF